MFLGITLKVPSTWSSEISCYRTDLLRCVHAKIIFVLLSTSRTQLLKIQVPQHENLISSPFSNVVAKSNKYWGNLGKAFLRA